MESTLKCLHAVIHKHIIKDFLNLCPDIVKGKQVGIGSLVASLRDDAVLLERRHDFNSFGKKLVRLFNHEI